MLMFYIQPVHLLTDGFGSGSIVSRHQSVPAAENVEVCPTEILSRFRSIIFNSLDGNEFGEDGLQHLCNALMECASMRRISFDFSKISHILLIFRSTHSIDCA